MDATAVLSLIRTLAAEEADATVAFRRHLHRHPELSFEESNTAAWISTRLEESGLPHRIGLGGNGITADIGASRTAPPAPQGPGLFHGNPAATGPTVVIRADMDALPIQEETGLDFASQNPGVMHACGHDGHSSMVFTAGRILHRLHQTIPGGLSGTVRLVFQPAEEKAPGGARAMIGAGAFADLPRPVFYGQHVNPGLPTGTFGFRSGMMMAGVDDLTIRVQGRGGHAAAPHLLADPVHCAAQLVIALQSLVSRASNPETPTVLSFGRMQADGAFNIIPDAVELSGTFRTVDSHWRAQALDRIKSISKSIAEAFGCSATVDIIEGYPPVRNDTARTDFARARAVEWAGADRVVDLPLVMWAEDFAYYSDLGPACFYNLGISPDPATAKPLHSSRLHLDEAALPEGAGFMAWLAWSELASQAT